LKKNVTVFIPCSSSEVEILAKERDQPVTILTMMKCHVVAVKFNPHKNKSQFENLSLRNASDWR
jgi:hypothetical protein